MKYSEFRWDKVGLAIVYGADESARAAFRAAFASTHRDFRSSTFDYIQNYKKGFLQRSRTIVELLVDHVPKAQRAAFTEKLKEQIDRAGLTIYKDRQPTSMGSEAMYRWTVLADVLCGQRKVLIYDSGEPNSHAGAMQMVRWLLGYDAKISVVWLTGIPEETLLEVPYYLEVGVDFCRAEGGGLTAGEKEMLVEKKRAGEILKQQIEAERRARWEAEMEKKMAQADRLLRNEKKQEALEIYRALSAENWTPAMVSAARLLYATNVFEQREEARELCRRADTAEGWILLGDWEMEKLARLEQSAKREGKKEMDQSEKRDGVDRLYAAARHYQRAAAMEDPEGCYKAARLHLQYTFTRQRSTSWETFTYTHDDAIPYIEQLIAMEEDGRAGVTDYLLEFELWNNEYYTKARTAYHNKK